MAVSAHRCRQRLFWPNSPSKHWDKKLSKDLRHADIADSCSLASWVMGCFQTLVVELFTVVMGCEALGNDTSLALPQTWFGLDQMPQFQMEQR